VIAQVMEIGDFDTVLQVRPSLGDTRLAQVLQRAEAGWFFPRSWTYWHRKLGVTPTGPVPPLPLRRDSCSTEAPSSPCAAVTGCRWISTSSPPAPLNALHCNACCPG